MNKYFLYTLIALFPAWSLAFPVEPKSAMDISSYELGDFIRMYMPNYSNSMDDQPNLWQFNADNPNMIWLTHGIETIENGSDSDTYRREGLVRINIQGRVPYSLKQRKVELAWNITYWSDDLPKFGVKEIIISNKCFGTMHNNCESEPLKSLREAKISYTKICSAQDLGTKIVGYALNTKGKKTTYLVQTDSCGSGGCSTSYSLYYQDNKNLCSS